MRIVNGESKDFCGHTQLVDVITRIEVRLKRKHLYVTTPAKNLLKLDTFRQQGVLSEKTIDRAECQDNQLVVEHNKLEARVEHQNLVIADLGSRAQIQK